MSLAPCQVRIIVRSAPGPLLGVNVLFIFRRRVHIIILNETERYHENLKFRMISFRAEMYSDNLALASH